MKRHHAVALASSPKTWVALTLVVLILGLYGFHTPHEESAGTSWVTIAGQGLIAPACGSSSVGPGCSGTTPVATIYWTTDPNFYCAIGGGPAYVDINGSNLGAGDCHNGSWTWTGGSLGGTYNYAVWAWGNDQGSIRHDIGSGTFTLPASCCVANVGASCSSGANVCGMTNTGTISCGGSCSASAPPDSACPPTATLTPNPSTIDQGQSSTLSWSSARANSCVSAGGFNTGGATSGSASTGALSQTSNYQLTCTGPVSPAANAFATVNVLVPTVSIGVSPTRVNSGGSTTVTWSATNVNSCTITKNGATLTTQAANGSRVVSGNTTDTVTNQTTYVITCGNNGSSAAASATTIVNINPGFQEF